MIREIQTEFFPSDVQLAFWACIFSASVASDIFFNKTLEKERSISALLKAQLKISPVLDLYSLLITKSYPLFSSGLILGHITVTLFCFFSQGWCFWKACHVKGWGNVMRRWCSRTLTPNSLMHDQHFQVLPLFNSCIFLYFRYSHAMLCWYWAQNGYEVLIITSWL